MRVNLFMGTSFLLSGVSTLSLEVPLVLVYLSDLLSEGQCILLDGKWNYAMLINGKVGYQL